MRIVVTSSGADLDAPTSPIFGRCQAYVFVDTETMAYDAVENPATGAASGAGIRAAQFVVAQGAQAVVTGNVGPNAFSVFQSAGVPIYPFSGGTVRQAAEAFRTGELQSIADATAQAGLGLRPESGMQPAMGLGRGFGMGRGMGRGLGRGRGMGRGMGAGTQRGLYPTPPAYGQGPGTAAPPETPATPSEPSQSEEIALLRETAQQLQKQLAQVMERLEQLQEEHGASPE